MSLTTDSDWGATLWPSPAPRSIEEGLSTLAALAALGGELDLSDSKAPARLRPPSGLDRSPHTNGAEIGSAQQGLRVAEARYRTLIEQIPAVTFLASLSEGPNEIYVSPQIESLLGFTQEEWVSDPVLWYRQTHPDDRDRVSLEFAALCLTGKPFRDIIRVFTRAGETVWVDAEARLVRDEHGQLLFLQGVGFDVSEQYRARQAREQLIREQAARAEADRERDRLREIFTGLPAAIALLREPDYRIEFLNPVALELAGGNSEVIGQSFSHVFGQFAELAPRVFDGVASSGEQFSARELRINGTESGDDRFFNVVCQPLHDERGPLILMHAVEVTEQVRARHAVEEALNLRDEFMSIASHELRTPIATLRAQAQLMLRRLERGALEPQRLAQAFHAINAQTGNLTRLVSQLLDTSRLQAGKLDLERELTDVPQLLQRVVDRTRSVSSGHVIVLIAPPAMEAYVDSLRLEQVVTNLLDNAVKYSPDGGAVEVRLERVGEDAAELSVRDHGLGIPPEKRGAIFERYYQAHGSSGGHRSGLGLGLYICRQIVEMHGGSITAEFPPDGGSRFVVRVRLGSPD